MCTFSALLGDLMIVEFIGAPGAGKTTLIPAVVETLQTMGFRALTVVDASRSFASRTILGKTINRLSPLSWRKPLLWQVFYCLSILYRLKFCIRHPKLVWTVFHTQWQRPKSADVRQRKVLYWFIRLIGYYEFLNAYAYPNEALVFDEGFVHRVVQLNASSVELPQPGQICAYLDLLPQPDLVIFVRSPRVVCERRILQRGLREPFRKKSSVEMAQFVTNAWNIVNLAVQHIKYKGWKVVEVNNGTDGLTVSTAEICTSLSCQISGSIPDRVEFKMI